MKSAPITEDEQQRINTLYGYNILDSEAEQVFDDLTQLASEICETPIALISLIDPERQWFKSRVGLDAQETSRDIAFCSHAIHERQVFEINDATQDERFFDNPLVTEHPNIKFYAGAQLIAPNGCALGTLCVISDQPKKLTDHQRRALEILSRDVIAQMELRKHLHKAKAESNFKTEFLSSMSHEIRTPLNAIVGFSQMLLEKAHMYNIPPECIDYIENIDFSSNHLLGIVNSILDLSKIEAGKMQVNKDWFNSQHFITNIIKMMSVKANEKGVKLHTSVAKDLPEHLYLDEQKVSQVLINIINNSIKFTPVDKSVYFEVVYSQQALTFVIKDEGIGISKDAQANLFNKFEQVGKQNQEGTGLGLAISQSLAKLMNGSLTLESEVNKGTQVTLSLPLENISPPETLFSANTETSAEQLKNIKILVVEDNPINRKLAKVMFNHIGYQVDFAEDGEQSLTMTDAVNYDVIFMDIHMPGINGIEAAHAIRKKNQEVAIVALTADVFSIQNNDENNFKFDDYVSKPIVKDSLQSSLTKVMAN